MVKLTLDLRLDINAGQELLFCLEAKLVKETKTYNSYDLKGDKIALFMVL
jgi:hypothetical protein